MRINKLISDKKKEIINNYDSTSVFYDKRYKKIQEQKYRIIFNDFQLEYNNFLDAGCGSGLFFEFILKNYESNQGKFLNYIGIDISLNMLRRFIKKYKTRIDKFNVNLILADIENLPLRSNKIDSICSITSLQNLTDIYKGIREIFKVGKHMANFQFSILKKNLDLDSLVLYLESKIIDLEIKNIESIEDIIIQGKLKKN